MNFACVTRVADKIKVNDWIGHSGGRYKVVAIHLVHLDDMWRILFVFSNGLSFLTFPDNILEIFQHPSNSD